MFRRFRASLLPFLLFTATLAPAQAASHVGAANADDVLAQAEAQATAQNKNILLTFSASWCGNCRLFDRFLADPTIHPIVDKLFVFADLDTGEHSGDKRHVNIPGGERVLASLGGKDAGYPYFVMLDPNGKPIANSIRPDSLGHGGNIGYPDAPWEIAWFMEMIKKASPTLSAKETVTIQKWLSAHSTTH